MATEEKSKRVVQIEIDDEVKRIITECKARATKIVIEQRERLDKLANALLCEWADAVLFATQRLRVDAATGKATPIGADGGQRVLRCIGGPACVAKNRFDLPAEIDLSWQSFVDNIGKGAAHA